jgi:hypothetical protein
LLNEVQKDWNQGPIVEAWKKYAEASFSQCQSRRYYSMWPLIDFTSLCRWEGFAGKTQEGAIHGKA